jgi:sugar lactone lactonase YvrE
MSSFKFFLASLVGSVAFGLPSNLRSEPRSVSHTISHSPVDVAQFALGTWVENIAVRSNGKILVTMISPPEIWEVDPFQPPASNSTKLVHRFDTAGHASGITEVGPDVFMVVGGSSIWRVDMNENLTSRVSEVVNIAPSKLLNGITTLDAKTGTVLVADSELGLIWRVNTKTLTYEVALQDDTMAPSETLGRLIGINGVRVWRDYVYYNNSPSQLVCRVRVDRASGKTVGPYEVIAQGVPADDFAVGQDGTVYAAEMTANVITHIQLNGNQAVVAGNLNSTDVAGATSAAFGRTKGTLNVLYVTTNGGVSAPVNGSIVEGGKVVAINL